MGSAPFVANPIRSHRGNGWSEFDVERGLGPLPTTIADQDYVVLGHDKLADDMRQEVTRLIDSALSGLSGP